MLSEIKNPFPTRTHKDPNYNWCHNDFNELEGDSLTRYIKLFLGI